MLRYLFLLFVTLGLVIQPVVVSAADKKPAKRVVHNTRLPRPRLPARASLPNSRR